MQLTMRFSFIAVCLACATGFTWAQASNETDKSGYSPGEMDKSGYSTGRTVEPETKGEKQPQGSTGPDHHWQRRRTSHKPTGRDPARHAVSAGGLLQDDRRTGEKLRAEGRADISSKKPQ